MMQYYTTDNNEFKQRYDVQFLYTFHSKIQNFIQTHKNRFYSGEKNWTI